MRDKKDHATLDLVGFGQPAIDDSSTDAAAGMPAAKRSSRTPPASNRKMQEQLELLAPTDATGLPVWQHDAGLDLTGLPVWAAA